ncbi:MAG: hypothetical protein HXX14_07325 [Bacteroidetes bacterium]|nr:hypothetical protein [Bacteroidota bacterium]
MAEINIVAFIKAVENKYFDDFIKKGQVCFNTVKWFREYEKSNQNVGDSYEGVEIACASGMTISFADPILTYSSEEELNNQMAKKDWKVLGIAQDFKLFDSTYDANIFSLYAITSSIYDGSIEEHLIPKKFIEEFSNHRFILIVNPRIFLAKMKNALRQQYRSMKYGMVKYYKFDEQLQSNLTCFDKKDKFAYQNEFRIVSADCNAERKIWNIGSLQKICYEMQPRSQMFKITNDKVELIIRMNEKQ